jgi:hypothetical protein
MAKRIKDNRRAKQNKAYNSVRPELLKTLARLAEGKTPPEIVDTHIAFYESCNPTAQQVLMQIFAERENQTQTDICRFFAEKDNAKK